MNRIDPVADLNGCQLKKKRKNCDPVDAAPRYLRELD
jgi:hypothetical protein